MALVDWIKKAFKKADALGDELLHRTYTVKKGDTLSSIAAAQLGGAEKWHRIQAMNDLKNPNLIHPGQVLKLPVV